MLIEFSVTNYRSIQARQTLSMAASSYFKELEEVNTIDVGIGENGPRLLRSTVLYGPNASGKSTLIRALKFVEDRVINSQRESQAGEEIDTVPFKLTADSRAAESEFEVTFVEKGVRYTYGFCCNRQRFTEEWLLAYPNGRPQKWLHRVFDASTGRDVYKPSASFKGGRKRQDLQVQTRANALFLSTAIQFNNEQLKPVFDWFNERLQVIGSANPLTTYYTIKQCKSEETKKQVIAFMNSADLSIEDVLLKKIVFSQDSLPDNFPSPLKEELLLKLNDVEHTRVRFVRRDIKTQETIEFTEDEESDGTKALFNFAGPWLDVIENDRVLVIDELDTSLHPLLVHNLVKRLNQSGSKAQLIFTTHDTTLLSQKLLRRDQVWFMEKDQGRATRLYPLSDFSPRENEAVERGYLNGRYGGIPFLKELDFYGIG